MTGAATFGNGEEAPADSRGLRVGGGHPPPVRLQGR